MGAETELFPAGLRVLVVDDDRVCLLILDTMLRQCLYRVTTCERAVDALKILRDNKDGFDVVISDVHMPDMDGYKLLELVGLEMDLPVLMMSSNSETSAVMKGIKHGACDYLLKPVRIEELKNIWQHVIRRKQRDLDGDDRLRLDDGADPLATDGQDGASKSTKKRKDNLEEEDNFEPENDDPATSKKPRVVWSVDLHQKFVNAVNSLGIDKAVPKRILELMDQKGLTRENVASHLQKYRLYLKRLSGGVAYQGGGGFFGHDDRFLSTGAGVVGDFRSQLPMHALLSALQPGFLDRVGPNSVDPIFLSQLATIQGINGNPSEKPPFGVPLLNSANSLQRAASSGLDLKHLGRGLGGGQVSHFTLSQGAHIERLFDHEDDHKDNALRVQILQQQQQQQRNGLQTVANGVLPETQRSNVQLVESGSTLSKINNSFNALTSLCRSSPEIATRGNFIYEPSTGPGLGPFRKKGVDARPDNNVSVLNYTSSSGLATLPHGVELSGKDGLSGLQSILSDQVGGNTAFRFGVGLTNNLQGWNDDHESGRQSGNSFVNSNYNQGSSPLDHAAPNLNYLQESKLGWMTNFHGDFVEDIDVKPLLATGTIPAFEQGLGERAILKAASLNSLASKVGAITEPFPSADDLLTCYIKQQQQDMVSLAEGEAAEGYTLGNMFVK